MSVEELSMNISRHLAVRGETNDRYTEQWVNELEIICGFEPHNPELYRFMTDPKNIEWRHTNRRGSHYAPEPFKRG